MTRVIADGGECTLIAPQSPGMYVIVVQMSDQTTETLKIQVVRK